MNDLKISTKLILLTSILSGFLLLTGWVGQSRLSTLNGNNESFSNVTIEKFVKVADIQRKLVEVIRSQKNAVLANTDSASNEFAASSETAAKDLKKGVGALELLLTAPSAKDLSAKLFEQVDDFAAMNKQCSDLARQNTAVSKAEAIAISLKSKETTDEILKLIDQVTAMLQNESKDRVTASQVIYNKSVLYIVATTASGLILGFLASFFVSRSVSRPISLLKNLAVDMASGNLMSRVNLMQKDEVGELATATDSLADSLAGVVRKIKNASSELVASSSDLGTIAKSLISQSESTSTRANDASISSVQLSTNISTMSSAAEELSISFAAISAATEEMSVSVGAISSAAEQTSSNVAAVSSAFHAISDAFEQVLGNVRNGAQVASNASHMADSATSTMQLLDRSSTEISKVTETIKMIALQTNLLALNATIEAASAGEAGKGFAVVAHEIKQLANQSARAAEDIATKIEGVQTGTRQAVGVIQTIAGVIKEINDSANGISKSVEQQSRAAQTISHNINEANSGVSQIARSIAEVAATANDMARSIAEATRGANDVSRNVGQAALVASSIAATIGEVSKATIETNRSANGVMTESKDLSQLSIELSQISSQFKIPSNGL